MNAADYTVVQKKGFYRITTPAGNEAKLDRVTTALSWVLKEAMGAMSYRGGKLFAMFLGEDEGDWEEMYQAWKDSPYDPNVVLRRDGDRGSAAHTLFEGLLKGNIELELQGEDTWWVHDKVGSDPAFVATKWDQGVVQLYLEHFLDIPPSAFKSEVRLWWTEHPIDECPERTKPTKTYPRGTCTHGFSGTTDVFWPAWGIDDLKTHIPGYRWSEYVQMAMYSLASEQMYGEPITRQRILLAHDTPDEETGKLYEIQDDRFLPASAGRLLWDLFQLRKAWGPKE